MELRLVAYRKWRPGLFLCLSFRYGLCVASSNVCTLPTFALLMTITNAFIISPDAETRYVSDDPSRGYGLLSIPTAFAESWYFIRVPHEA
ncbi:hypothetical protein PGT21_009867 [Puccinia graminis f. sp. tritici]|uniref:Uncharacterized protein n=1 Tax=Puccinia graminis f. sp. tritici TaxID=56615 RepID=A0A5B0RGF2_PUCGR|nr:hypothetical protein PGT21_009867 [Puccinia graminis f. sp. tritici]KAA1124258.1 hypothetical protein PGTUg99_019323 [Puccinia graminis f. sp. tritici]